MRMCKQHWDELRAAIDARGLGGLVARSGEAAFEALRNQLEGDAQKADYDPLMAANFAIWGNALNAGGLYLMFQQDGKELCPLCELAKHGGKPANWVAGAADEQLHEARRLGLVAAAQ